MEIMEADNTVEPISVQLYVSGMTPKSMEAIANINRLCAAHPAACLNVEIIDIYKNPEAALAEHIVFCPSLIKNYPLPRKVLIGTLSDNEKVKKALGIL